MASSVAYAEPLELYITIPIYSLYPSANSLQSMNVDTVYPNNDGQSYVIGELLDNNSSIHVTRSGGKGQQTSVFTRGTNSNHTLFMINGSPITDHSTTNHLFDAGVDPVNYATSIDLYKGSNSSYFGHNAIGGAVNINTDVAVDDVITLSTGSNNSNTVAVEKGFNIDNSMYSIKLMSDQSDGYSVVKDGDKDGYRYEYINFDSQHWVNNGILKTTIINRNTDVDLDGSGVDDTDYTSDQNFQMYQLIYEGNQLQWVLDHNAYDRQFVNGSEIDDYNSKTNHARISTNKKLNEMNFVLGSDISFYSADFQNRGSYNSSVDKSDHTYGTFLNFDWIGEKLIVNGGIRNDWHSQHDAVQTYRIGTSYKLQDGLSLITGTSTGFRSPSLYELYGADNFGYTGNPNLQEETSLTYEIGLKATKNKENSSYENKATVFRTEITDQIVYANSTYSNDTGGKTIIEGFDMSSNLRVDNTTIGIGLMYVDAKDSSDVQLLRRPWWQSNINLKQAINNNLQIWSNYEFYGKHKDTHSTNYTTIERPAQHTVNAGFDFAIKDNMTVSGVVSNLLDAENERPHGYSQPGQEYNLTFKYKF